MLYSEDTGLFHKCDLNSVLQSHERDFIEEINDYETNIILNTNADDLVNYFVEKFKIQKIELLEENICVSQYEKDITQTVDYRRKLYDYGTSINLKGTAFIFEIPFMGDPKLFYCSPSMTSSCPPKATVEEDKLSITYNCIDRTPEEIKNEFTKNLNHIKQFIERINSIIEPWNMNISDKIKEKIEVRKNKLLKDQGLVAALGFPLKTRKDDLTTFITPKVRRKIPLKPQASDNAYVPEPAIQMEEYEHIIKLLIRSASVFEKSPKTFQILKEEQLRDLFIVNLNGHYEGQVTGETFNFNGKTDILIKEGSKNLFIAECKFWHGQKHFLEAIDQLLGYATWRDTKLALIFFNKTKDLSNVLTKITDTIKTHNNFKKELNYNNETGYRCVLKHKDDENRELILTTLVFEIPN